MGADLYGSPLSPHCIAQKVSEDREDRLFEDFLVPYGTPFLLAQTASNLL